MKKIFYTLVLFVLSISLGFSQGNGNYWRIPTGTTSITGDNSSSGTKNAVIDYAGACCSTCTTGYNTPPTGAYIYTLRLDRVSGTPAAGLSVTVNGSAVGFNGDASIGYVTLGSMSVSYSSAACPSGYLSGSSGNITFTSSSTASLVYNVSVSALSVGGTSAPCGFVNQFTNSTTGALSITGYTPPPPPPCATGTAYMIVRSGSGTLTGTASDTFTVQTQTGGDTNYYSGVSVVSVAFLSGSFGDEFGVTVTKTGSDIACYPGNSSTTWGLNSYGSSVWYTHTAVYRVTLNSVGSGPNANYVGTPSYFDVTVKGSSHVH